MNNKPGIDEALAASFKELADKRPLEKITIKEITDCAGVIRPTFYNHFQDKYELMEWIINTELLLPMRPLIEAGMIKEGMTLLFTNIGKDRVYYGKAVKMDGPISFHQIAMKAVQQFLEQILGEMTSGKSPRHAWLSTEVISTYYAQSMVFAAEEWIKGNMDLDPAEMAEAYLYIMSRSFTDIINEM